MAITSDAECENFNDQKSFNRDVKVNGGSSAVWGGITGTLSDQTDLQSALDAKQATITGGASTIVSSDLTVSRALVSNGSGKVAVSSVTSTELSYSSGVTSAIQTQLNSKQSTITPGSSSQFLKGDFSLGTIITALSGFTNDTNFITLSSISATSPIFYSNSTGVISSQAATTSLNGYLTSTDWNTFSGKQAALGFTPENVANKDTDGTLAANSDTKYASQKATKTYADAIMTTATVGSLINGSGTATPNDTDLVATAESSVLKKITWTNVKAFLKTYFDGIYQASLGFTAENIANKDASGGYPGLTLFKINFKNAANTFTSLMTNANTAIRTYTFQDRDGTIADDTDLAGKQATLVSATNIKTINSTSLLGSGDISTVQTSVSGNAGTVTVSDAAGDTTTWVMVAGTQTGNQSPLTDSGITYNATANSLTATTFVGALNGNASTATSATSATNATNTGITDDTTTSATMYPTWVTTTTGNLPQKVSSTKLTFNPSTGVLSATTFSGAGTSLTGTGASFTAGNVTTNANLTGIVTSVGNATAIAAKAIAISKLADGTAGQLITWDASNVIATVAAGTAAQVLTSNGAGAAPTFQAVAATADPLSIPNASNSTSDSYYSDDLTQVSSGVTTVGIYLGLSAHPNTNIKYLSGTAQTMAASTLHASPTGGSSIISGGYVYYWIVKTSVTAFAEIWRCLVTADISNIANWTKLTISGTALGVLAGDKLIGYGNSWFWMVNGSGFVPYSLSGTTLTAQSTVTVTGSAYADSRVNNTGIYNTFSSSPLIRFSNFSGTLDGNKQVNTTSNYSRFALPNSFYIQYDSVSDLVKIPW